MKTAARIFSISALVVLLLAGIGAYADSHVRIVRLSYLQGDVNVDLGQGAGSQRAMLNMPVVEGSRLWTGNDGQAEVEFEDGSSVRITPNTGLEFVALTLRDNGGRVNTVKVVGGTAYVDVPKLAKEDDFTFQLPNRAITLDHSVHFRIDMDGMEARIAVFKGQLDVTGERTVDIRKGETLTLNFNDAGQYNLANNVASLAYDAWDKDRDDIVRDAFDSYSRNSNWYPYGYGFADMMNYGSVFSAAGFGNCWRPYGVGLNWDPFDYGYWSYYSGFGYTWVSGYPWGWAPYRYGSWNYISGTGFSWCPGFNNPGWRTWNVVPVVVSGPPRWHAPQRPDRPNAGPPPIVPVGGRRGPAPYRGGLVQDKPENGNGNGNGGNANPEDRRGPGHRPTVKTDSAFAGGSPASTGGGGAPMIANPVEQRSHGPRPGRGIDLTPPGGSPSGRSSDGGGPTFTGRSPVIESPAPVVHSPSRGTGGSGPQPGDRSFGDRGGRSSGSDFGGGRIGGGSSPGPSAPSPGPMAPASSGPMSSPAPAPHAPAPPSGGGGHQQHQ